MNNRKYKYFENVKKYVAFTEEKCQFCGKNTDCFDGVYFDNDEIESVCIDCFEKKKAEVIIPDYLKNKIKNNVNHKVDELRFTPPVPWIQYNDWNICCDDFSKYLGEWKKEDFIEYAKEENPIVYFKNLLSDYTLSLVDDINILWNDIGKYTVAYVFECQHCKKKTVICQSY